MNSKIETYIGFAIKKGSVVFGCDNIGNYRKKVYLLLKTKTLSNNSASVIQSVAEKRAIELLEIDDYDLLAKRNCKALAICDKSLADAIITAYSFTANNL